MRKIAEMRNSEIYGLIRTATAELESREQRRAKRAKSTVEVVQTEPKTANQQRAELIQRAREFMEKRKGKFHGGYTLENKDGYQYVCDAKFIHDSEKRTTTCILIGQGTGYTRKKVVARCHPNEVFNERIGELVSLCMCLGDDIPLEFLDAVQPDEKVIGQRVKWDESTMTKPGYTSQISPPGRYVTGKGRCAINSEFARNATIIDDTNAVYEV